jgi:hypothetical protein
MEDIIANDIYNYAIFYSPSGKYNGTIWTSSHVVMTNHICGLGL